MLRVFLRQILQATFFREFRLVLLSVTSDLLSSFDLSLKRLGVLLHGETQVLVLHGVHVEVGRWDGREHFDKLQLVLHLLDICIGFGMLRDWLAAAFLRDVFLIVLRLVSVAVLWFALPAVGKASFCLACRWLCSCLACRRLCSSRFFSSLLPAP